MSALVQSVGSLENLSTHDIRSWIEELEHQLVHLERSQQELLDAIQDSPNDEDFAEAFWENTRVIASKKAKIDELIAGLEELDPVYYREKVLRMQQQQLMRAEDEMLRQAQAVSIGEASEEQDAEDDDEEDNEDDDDAGDIPVEDEQHGLQFTVPEAIAESAMNNPQTENGIFL